MRRLTAAALVASCVAGCAAPAPEPSAIVTSRRMQAVTPDGASAAIAIGRSTRAEVAAALGETLVINFDNGYEVWVYRVADGRPRASSAPGANAELVVLFSPSGVAAKSRLRAAPGPR